MVLEVPGLGAARVVNLAVGLEASGALAQLSQLNAQAGAIGVTFADAADNIGVVQGQLALLGFTATGTAAAMTKAFSDFEKQATLANVAAGNIGQGMQGIRERAQQLSTDLAQPPAEMAELIKQVEFFGLESEQASDRVARFSQVLADIGDTDAPMIAKNLTRLLNITRRGGETTEQATQRFDELAGALFRVSTSITAPLPDLLKFIETFKVIGVQSSLTEREIVAIAGSVADLDDRMRALTTTAAQRIFLTEEFEAIAEEANNVRPELEATGDTIMNMRAEEPVEFLRTIVEILDVAQDEQRLLEVMRNLNVGTLRSARGLSALIANWEKAEELLIDVQDPQAGMNELLEGHNEIMDTASKRLDAFVTSINNLLVDSGQLVGGVLIPLIDMFGGLATMIRQNETALHGFTLAATALPFGIVAVGINKLMGAMKPLAGLIGFLTGGRTIQAAAAGRSTFGGMLAENVPLARKGMLGIGAAGALAPLTMLFRGGDDAVDSTAQVIRAMTGMGEQEAKGAARRLVQGTPPARAETMQEITGRGFRGLGVQAGIEEQRLAREARGGRGALLGAPAATLAERFGIGVVNEEKLLGRAAGMVQELTEAEEGFRRIDATRLVKDNELVGRQMEVQRLARTLSGRHQRNLGIVGETGTDLGAAFAEAPFLSREGLIAALQDQARLAQGELLTEQIAGRLRTMQNFPVLGRILAARLAESGKLSTRSFATGGRGTFLSRVLERGGAQATARGPGRAFLDFMGAPAAQAIEDIARWLTRKAPEALTQPLRAVSTNLQGLARVLGRALPGGARAAIAPSARVGAQRAAGLGVAGLIGTAVPGAGAIAGGIGTEAAILGGTRGATVIGILQLLAVPLDKLGDKLRELAGDGGTLDVTIHALSLLAEVASTIGRFFNFAFNVIVVTLEKIFDFANQFVPFDISLTNILSETAQAFDDLNQALARGSEVLESGGDDGGGTTIRNNITVQGSNAKQQTERSINQIFNDLESTGTFESI